MKRGALLTCVVVLLLSGCSLRRTGEGVVGDAPSSAGPDGAQTRTTNAPSHAGPLTCAQLSNAQVSSPTLPLADYSAKWLTVSLTEGRFTGEDGTTIELQPQCAAGDLDKNGVADALGVVKIATGGTARYYTLVAWRWTSSGVPQMAASDGLGDRNPVVDITIAANKATVVYLTRTADVPLAGVNVKRTAVYLLSGTALVELSHTDEPYTP